MSAISFFSEKSDFTLYNAAKTKKWITKVVRDEGFKLVRINYIFCSDEYLHTLNLNYLSHDTYTDILTFDQSESENEIEGDIYISIERVEENSGKLENSFDHELHRVLIHGILHLMGFPDKTPGHKNTMRKKEDSFLSLYFV